MKVYIKLGLILLALNVSGALIIKPPSTATKLEEGKEENYATEASRIVAINLLKSYNDIDSNQVHAPLGVTTMLTILAEASQGRTYQEFCKVLHYPMDRSKLRIPFKKLLNNYQTRAYGYEPSFQTWLYIYRNFSANDDFKQLMRDNYYVVVKDINYNDYDWVLSDTALDLGTVTPSSPSSTSTGNSKDVIGFETLKRFKVNDNYDDDINNNDDMNGADDDDNKPDLLTTTIDALVTENYGNEFIDKEPSKFDRTIDDKLYIETTQEQLVKEEEQSLQNNVKVAYQENQGKPVKVDAIETSSDRSSSKIDVNLEENETVQENEKTRNKVQSTKNLIAEEANGRDSSNEPEKVSLPLKKLATVSTKRSTAEELFLLSDHAQSDQNDSKTFRGRRLFRKDDITSALSANSLTGRESNSRTQMLLFNGLYFRGTWAIPFLDQEQDDNFFMTNEDVLKVHMMHAKGKFQTADLPHLNARILCLPYENKKYAMWIILPNNVEGLHKLIKEIQTGDLEMAKESMLEQSLHVTLPKFQFEETSRSDSMLKSLGLTRIFSRNDADLSLLSPNQNIHVDEIVQFVNIRVDDSGSSEAGLSALESISRNADPEPYELFDVNHPFVYLVIDCETDFILVSGKVLVPEIPNDLPVTIQVDFN